MLQAVGTNGKNSLIPKLAMLALNVRRELLCSKQP